ncbi:MAG: type II toxin-antitoxin system HicB family antitoxin [Oligoflexia bacterium]|nr:type II toxin-antitoxin system HicB family antitoxin [Oligoflexia bacterium]
MIQYQAKITKSHDSYTVIFPDLPGCFTQGETLEEVLEMAKEALTLYLEEARNPKWEIPKAKARHGKNYHWIVPELEVAIPLMIRQKRLDAGLTQQKLAKKLEIPFQQLQKLETPRKSNPTVQTLEKISEALNGKLEVNLIINSHRTSIKKLSAA